MKKILFLQEIILNIIPDGDDSKPCNIFVGVDPATDSARRNSDFSVIVVVAVTPDNNLYVLDYIRNRTLPVLGVPGTGKKGIVDYIFEFIIPFKEEKPGTRMSKRDRIQEILAQRFAVGQVHIKKSQYDLHREIITFGPRMAHDDTIDALAYACKYAHPPQDYKESKEGWYKKKPKARSWVTA